MTTQGDIYTAAKHLAKSDRGRKALKALDSFMDNSSSLDSQNQRAVIQILTGYFGAFTGSAIDAVETVLDHIGA